MPIAQPATDYVSWPPTRLRLGPAAARKDADVDREADPLGLFLDGGASATHRPLTSPSYIMPIDQDADADADADLIFEFDAGIENPRNPRRDVVESISPSTLDCLRRAAAVAHTVSSWSSPPSSLSSTSSSSATFASDADSDMGVTDSDDDQDGEYYVRFVPHRAIGKTIDLDDFTIDGVNPKMTRHNSTLLGHKTVARSTASSGSLLSSPPPPPASSSTPNRGREMASRRRQQMLWREPSPDVWSISEETEEQLGSEVGEDSRKPTDERATMKKVRFVLPARED